MVHLESDSCPGNAEGKQRLTFSGGARGMLLLLHWSVFLESAEANHAGVYPVQLVAGEASGGLECCPVGPLKR